MTVGELKAKLELYKDDVEIFTGNYDDLMGTMWYSAPTLSQTLVDANKNKHGEWYYSRWGRKNKKHVILVIE